MQKLIEATEGLRVELIKARAKVETLEAVMQVLEKPETGACPACTEAPATVWSVTAQLNPVKVRKPRKAKQQTSSEPDEPVAGKPPDWSGRSKAGMEAKRRAMVAYIVANGPTKLADLGRGVGIPTGTLHRLADHEWFERTNGKIEITNEARQAVNGEKED